MSVCQSSDLLERLTVSLKDTEVLINPEFRQFNLNTPYSCDVETDEKDNLVGFGLWNGEGPIYYFTNKEFFDTRLQVFGHNFKSDWHWFKKWGININPNNIVNDTILMSYVFNPTREKHGLKSLAKEILNNPYPKYKEIVFGRNRMTLDKQPIGLTAKYCGNDVKATYELYQYFNKRLTLQQKALLNNIELPLMKLLFKIEELGIQVDSDYLRKLKVKFDKAILESRNKLGSLEVNFNSPKQVKDWLLSNGIKLSSTDKKFLSEYSEHPKVKELLNYRELCKLQSTYVEPLLNQERIHTEFNQLITTGRLSSRNPNLQNIPTKTERGNLLRKAFIAKPGHILIDADYSQIEYRLLAHFSQEPLLLEAYRKGADIHEETAKLLGVSRYLGKTLNFASIYGAGPKKIVQTVNSSGEDRVNEEICKSFLETYWKKLPKVKYWVEKTKEEARSKKAYRTLSGQYFPLTNINSYDKMLKWHSERQAVNGTIQGSAAYIIKLAMLELEKRGWVPILQVHDELIFEELEKQDNILVSQDIKDIMENVIKLDVPLVVDMGMGHSWDKAKQ